MQKRNLSQNKRIHALCNKLNINSETRQEMIYESFSKKSSSELTYAEAEEFIEYLETMGNMQRAETQQEKLKQQLRRGIFKIMYDLGWISSNEPTKDKVAFINYWILEKTRFNKKLNSLNLDELMMLNNQLQAIRRNYKNSVSKQAQLN